MKTVIFIILMANFTWGATFQEQLERIEAISTKGPQAARCDLEVINGTETNEYPAVGSLRRMYSTPNTFNMPQSINLSLCTATKVAPRKILTAGHCIHELKEGEFYEFNGSPLKIKEVHVHPRYVAIQKNQAQGRYSEVDLAIIELSEDAPGPMMNIDFSRPTQNLDITMIGYGYNDSGFKENESGEFKLVQSGSGVKRVGHNRILSTKGDIIRVEGRTENRNLFGWEKLFFGQVELVDGSESSLAPGDSGGPLIYDGKVIGVASAGTSAIGLPKKNGLYESRYTPFYTEENKTFLKAHIP